MRIFSAGIATETNTFGPMPTGLASFKEGAYFPAGTHPEAMLLFSGPLMAARERGRPLGWTLHEGLVAMAQPSGLVTRATWLQLRGQLLADLQAAGPVDIVLLGLHGAMVAEGEDDCEGDLLQRVRAMVGPQVVVGAELDPHHHLSERMVAAADLLVAFKEYPHTDALERGRELLALCLARAEGRIRPRAVVADTGMITIIHTTRDPGAAFVRRIRALEGRDGILSVSITHGFPWGDVADMGTKVLVYADAAVTGALAHAQRLARELADDLYAHREVLGRPYPGIDDALDQALAVAGGPVVLADSADNPGGGAAGDSTFILRRLLERGIGSAALGPLWDPQAVRLAFEAGEGATLMLRIGGKVSAMSGTPVDLRCRVRALAPGMSSGGLSGSRQHLGDCALVEGEGIAIVLASVRHQAIATDLFTQLGVDLAACRLVVVKSSQHFHAQFAPIAQAVVYVDAPGTVTQDLKSLPYTRVKRPRWPL